MITNHKQICFWTQESGERISLFILLDPEQFHGKASISDNQFTEGNGHLRHFIKEYKENIIREGVQMKKTF